MFANIIFDKVDKFFVRRMKKRLNKRKDKEEDI